MKVIGRSEGKKIIVEMTTEELANLAGFRYESELDKAFKVNLYSNYTSESFGAITKLNDIKVSEIFKQAKETLSEYSVLKNKFQSIRNQLTNQLTNLLSKMEKCVEVDS